MLSSHIDFLPQLRKISLLFASIAMLIIIVFPIRAQAAIGDITYGFQWGASGSGNGQFAGPAHLDG